MAQGGLTRAPGIFRLAHALALAAILLLAGAVRAQAGDTQVEFVSEANAYLKLSDQGAQRPARHVACRTMFALEELLTKLVQVLL